MISSYENNKTVIYETLKESFSDIEFKRDILFQDLFSEPDDELTYRIWYCEIADIAVFKDGELMGVIDIESEDELKRGGEKRRDILSKFCNNYKTGYMCFYDLPELAKPYLQKKKTMIILWNCFHGMDFLNKQEDWEL